MIPSNNINNYKIVVGNISDNLSYPIAYLIDASTGNIERSFYRSGDNNNRSNYGPTGYVKYLPPNNNIITNNIHPNGVIYVINNKTLNNNVVESVIDRFDPLTGECLTPIKQPDVYNQSWISSFEFINNGLVIGHGSANAYIIPHNYNSK